MKTREMLEVLIENALARAGYECETRRDGQILVAGNMADADNYVISVEEEPK